MSENLSINTLEQLQAQMELLQAKVAQQEAEIAKLRDAPTEIVEGVVIAQPTSRRRMLKRLMVVAAGTAAAGTALLGTGAAAQASGGDNANIGWFAFPYAPTAATNLPNRAGLAGSTESNFGNTDVAIAGVYGFSSNDVGVRGRSLSGNGVVGSSDTRTGVLGSSKSNFGVRGTSVSSDAVSGASTDGNGVFAFSINGAGVSATSVNFTALMAATTGNAVSIGVLATSTEGKAVYGRSSANYGGMFYGGKAPLRLEPSSTVVGHPTTDAHEVGEFFVDKEGTLFYCAVAGTPGRWYALTPPTLIK